jgi:uncharacterized protein YkwD
MAVEEGLNANLRRMIILVLTVLFVAAILSTSDTAFSSQDLSGADNPLSIEMTISPWASTPGEKVSLILSMRNDGLVASMPDVTILLPEQVVPDISTIPTGTNYNYQTGGLAWQPYLEPLGGISQIEIWLSISVAQINEVEQGITAVVRNNGEEWRQETSMWIGALPQAYITFDPPQVAVGQPVRLIANANGSSPGTQIWSLDDGRVVAANDPEVVFPSSGPHVVTLQITNPLGSTQVNSQIEVFAQPNASFAIEDYSTVADSSIEFINRSGGELPLSYTWDFGDGTISNEKNPQHRYPAAGVYRVNLGVENAFGRSETSSYVEIGAPPSFELLVAEFEEAGNIVHGQVLTEKSTTMITWDMGDGRQYRSPDVSHIYWRPGDYVLTVTASNEFGDMSVSRWIRIGHGTLRTYVPYLARWSRSDIAGSTSLFPGSADGTVNIGLGPQPELLPGEFSQGTTPAEKLFVYINEARRLFNLRPLAYVYTLSVAAQGHADDMATFGFASHTGSDGSSPAYRLQLAGYTGGYGGEATAWGMSDPIEPVRFWLTSPSHRAIILNPAVSEVGVGYSANFSSPNVWYWTAEFASLNLPVVGAPPPQAPIAEQTAPQLLLLGPPQSSEFILADGSKLIFSWSWNGGVFDGQRFALYLSSGGRTFQSGVVRQSQDSGQYQLSFNASNLAISPGSYTWQIRLEDSNQGIVIAESPIWQVIFVPAGQGSPEGTPVPVSTIPTAIPTATVSTPIPPPAEPTSDQQPLPISTPIPTVGP